MASYVSRKNKALKKEDNDLIKDNSHGSFAVRT